MMEVVSPDAVKCEENGKRISQEVVDQLWYVAYIISLDGITIDALLLVR